MHIFNKFFILRLMELPNRVAAGMQKSLNGSRDVSSLNSNQAEVNLCNLKYILDL